MLGSITSAARPGPRSSALIALDPFDNEELEDGMEQEELEDERERREFERREREELEREGDIEDEDLGQRF